MSLAKKISDKSEPLQEIEYPGLGIMLGMTITVLFSLLILKLLFLIIDGRERLKATMPSQQPNDL